MTADPAIKFLNAPKELEHATLVDFWRWAFSDLSDDDLKGIFAEWMVSKLLGAETRRRISWADSDLILPNGIGVEVKATALWQSYKLVDQHGSPKQVVPVAVLDPKRIRFGGLQARTLAQMMSPNSHPGFKSQIYVFCFQAQIDATQWNAWDLAQWEFYVMTREELSLLKVGRSISLATLRGVRPAMTAQQLGEYFQSLSAIVPSTRSISRTAVATECEKL